MMESICVSYRLGPSDLVRAVEAHHGRRFGAVTLIGWAVSFAALGLVLHRDDAASSLVLGAFALAGLVGLGALGCPALAAWRWYRHRRIFAPTRVTVGAEGIDVQGGAASGRHAWSRIDCYAVLPQLFILYRGADFVLVPKRAFESAGELEGFREALRLKLGDPSLVRG